MKHFCATLILGALAACGNEGGAGGASSGDAIFGNELSAGSDAADTAPGDSGGAEAATTDVATAGDAGVLLDAAPVDAVADAGILADGAQCLGFMVACTNSTQCCAPHTCMNMGSGPKCQSEGIDVPKFELPPDVKDSWTPPADTGPIAADTGPVLTDAKSDAADVAGGVSCGAGGKNSFPNFLQTAKGCSSDGDCFLALHQINCCGTFVAWGLNKSAKDVFASSEALCESQYPGCGCASFQTMAEDGYSAFDNAAFGVQCAAGSCKSYVVAAKPLCTSQGLQDPKPVKECSVASDCDFVLKTTDCCGSQMAVGIASFAKAAYEVEETKCAAGMAICDCMPQPTQLEDGKVLTGAAAPVACVAGSCLTGTWGP